MTLKATRQIGALFFQSTTIWLTSSSLAFTSTTLAPWHPCPNITTTITTTTTPLSWPLDNGGSHHITTDLGHLSLHSSYTSSDDVLIGDDTSLPITHIGSTTRTSPTTIVTLNNVFYVPNMTKNLLSIFRFCHTNHTSIEFLPSYFSYDGFLHGDNPFEGSNEE